MKLLFIICATILVVAQAEKKIVCYWGSWSTYRPGDGGFQPSNIDPQLCTHLIYTFVGLPENTDFEVQSLDRFCDFPDGGGKNNIALFNQLREQNPQLKTLVAVGGWNQGSPKYSRVAADPNLRQRFIESAVSFVKNHGFDGLDVDWEYPAQQGGSPADKQNYILLLKELRERFDQEGLLLSAAVAAPESSARISYDIPQMSKYLDFINIMAYDLHGDYMKTGMNAALYPASSESGNAAKLNIDSVINYWLSEGAPAEKIVLGVPFYGRSFTLSNPQSNGVGAPSSKGISGPHTKELGMLGYNEICEKLLTESWNVKFDEERRVPYAFSGNNWVSYDDPQSLKEKAELINKYNLGGAMVWSIETDDFHGKCGEKFPLLKTLNSELRNGVSPAPSKSHPKGEAQKSRPQYQPSYESPQSEPDYSQQYQPDYSQQQYEPSYAQPEYPQQQASNGQICQADGLVRDPNDCSKYYQCRSYNGGFIEDQFSCPAGLVFDSTLSVCNWPYAAQC